MAAEDDSPRLQDRQSRGAHDTGLAGDVQSQAAERVARRRLGAAGACCRSLSVVVVVEVALAALDALVALVLILALVAITTLVAFPAPPADYHRLWNCISFFYFDSDVAGSQGVESLELGVASRLLFFFVQFFVC